METTNTVTSTEATNATSNSFTDIIKNSVLVTFEIRLKEKTGSFVNTLAAIPGIQTAVLISYNGDYVS